ncbi:Hypothetical protein ETEE_0262 [Edwardsiella anguillarum ET080813]|uniref:Uncharacterized protein n=1 Tax=Edwardsiella anguillarum ET080813 TaxID=667120 RepID=A0A076LIN2_9GAMM|nr:Hypothetical protein ETEE_0262 [Edwardsiella anguillarum ET080813]
MLQHFSGAKIYFYSLNVRDQALKYNIHLFFTVICRIFGQKKNINLTNETVLFNTWSVISKYLYILCHN